MNSPPIPYVPDQEWRPQLEHFGSAPVASVAARVARKRKHDIQPGEQWSPHQPGSELVRKYKVQQSIQGMRSLAIGWDGYSAEPPSQTAIAEALQALDVLDDLGSPPIRAVALADGGIALVIMARPFYAALEFYNDGDAVVAFSDRKDLQQAWDVSSEEAQLKAAIERLRELMHG